LRIGNFCEDDCKQKQRKKVVFHRVISSNPTVSARALYLKTLLLILGWIDVAIKSLMSTFDV